MKNIRKIIFLIFVSSSYFFSQNLISNGSFSEWNNNDSTKYKKINFKKSTDIKDWYYPQALRNLNYDEKHSFLLRQYYYSAKEFSLYKKKKFDNKLQFPELVFDKNDGFIFGYIGDSPSSDIVLQQKLVQAIKDSGYYILKFKLKINQHRFQMGSEFPNLSFCFSKNDLSYYFNGRRLQVPFEAIQFMYIPSYNNLQFDLDWQTVCAKIYLTKGTRYFTFGDLFKANLKKPATFGLKFLIDDIQLYKAVSNDSLCTNNAFIPDLNFDVTRTKFPLDTLLFNKDSLAVDDWSRLYTRTYSSYGSRDCFTQGTIYKLKQLILFLTENRSLNITINGYCARKHTYLDKDDLLTSKVKSYLEYYGISDDRVRCVINHFELEGISEEEKKILSDYEKNGRFSILIK